MSGSLEPARRGLATAARALDAYRRLSGVESEPPAGDWRDHAGAGARAALEDARARLEEIGTELELSRRAAAEREAELATTRGEAAALAATLAEERSGSEAAQRRASEASARASLLEAECVRLETLRHAADKAAADADAQGRDVADALRREIRGVNGALDRAAVAAGAADAKSRAEIESLRARLEGAAARVQALERDRRLEQSRGAGDATAATSEQLKAQAVAAALRRELNASRAAAEGREEALRREARLERVRAEAEATAVRDELLKARVEAASLARELDGQRAAADARGRDDSALRGELEDLRAQLARAAAAIGELDAARRDQPAAEPAGPAAEPVPRVAEADRAPAETEELPEFTQPPIEPILDPGWARLMRLVRPPIDSAYAHLRRLSATAMTAGQRTLLRLAAASIARASDSLSSVELSLEEGPAPGPPAPAAPLLEESLAAWEAAFRGRGVALVRELSAPLPEAALDPKELRLAFHHVLRNVLEAVPRGGRLAVRAWSGPDGGLRLEFLDDGPGFPADWLARRFEPFAAPRRGRAGLGLALVRRTLRRWGGDVEASNGPSGRGARLTFLFGPPPPKP